MNTILLIIIFAFLGLLFGFLFAKVIFSISSYLLRKNIQRQALKEERKFLYKDKPYDLKGEIEKEQSKRKRFNLFNIFKKKKKGGSEDGTNTGNIESLGREQVFTDDRGIEQDEQPTSSELPVSTPEPEDRGEQIDTTPPEDRGEPRRDFNSNLFKKGK